MIDQLTVFLENNKGRLTAMCRTVGDANVNMHALVVADTTDYGIVRIVCDKPEDAVEALTEAGFRATIAQVIGVEVPDVPGGLADVFETLEEGDVNIEYSYCFAHAKGGATVAFKAKPEAEVALAAAGFKVLDQTDLA